jgi:hypothetical protein
MYVFSRPVVEPGVLIQTVCAGATPTQSMCAGVLCCAVLWHVLSRLFLGLDGCGRVCNADLE